MEKMKMFVEKGWTLEISLKKRVKSEVLLKPG